MFWFDSSSSDRWDWNLDAMTSIEIFSQEEMPMTSGQFRTLSSLWKYRFQESRVLHGIRQLLKKSRLLLRWTLDQKCLVGNKTQGW